ncbi:MAG: DUF5635 domain-containing protein [Kineosporiaceae bacterium]
MAVTPGSEVLEDRQRLLGLVDRALALLTEGRSAAACEVERVDFKEEAGRRGPGGVIEPGEARSRAVAAQLADEVACLANTPGGGALIVGVTDDGQVIGAASDRDWLRQRIHELIEVAPAIEVRQVAGASVLVVLVAEAREPVTTTAGHLRWRVGATCAPVDRSEWWNERIRRQGADTFAAPSTRTLADVAPGAIGAVRRLLGGGQAEASSLPDRDLLTRLGALLPDGRLTAAGALMVCPAPRTLIELAAIDVPGGSVTVTPPELGGASLAEQLVEVESRLDVLDRRVPQTAGLALDPVRQIPWPAVREALLNAVVHRDWLPADPVTVTWVESDATLDVVSPGGFVGGITADSVLSARYSRNPALADLARAMHLVERQGIGVDRMYREMVVLGHRPPQILEEPGPRVRTRLVGGDPLPAVVAVTAAVEPAVRRGDVRVALAVYALLKDGFVTPRTLAALLQVPLAEASDALEVVGSCSLGGDSDLVRWLSERVAIPGEGVVVRARTDPGAFAAAQRRGLFRWHRPDGKGVRPLVVAYMSEVGRMSTGDLADITGFTQANARIILTSLEESGVVRRGAGSPRGRNAHFVLAESLAAIED